MGERPSFAALFGRVPAITADAPGRANLIGEHTDYNEGFVLPTVIPQRTLVELASRPDRRVRASSLSFGRPGEVLDYTLGEESPGRDWLDYLQGITRTLRTEGYPLSGFDARITSDVPVGSGLASSAALEVALLRALRVAFAPTLDDLDLARIGRRAENEFVGAQVGILDQMAASLGDEGMALFIDTRSLAFERIPLPEQMDLVVLHSGVAHKHASGGYNTRRAECRQACELLGVRQLRDLGLEDLARLDNLPQPLNRRARHVITENARVLAAVEALRAGDVRRLGALFYASHASMRDDYEVSIPEIDLIVELARAMPEIYGARLTGGGFGGSVVMLATPGSARAVASRIAKLYTERSGREPAILLPEAARNMKHRDLTCP